MLYKIINQHNLAIFHHNTLEIKVKLQISYKELKSWVSSKLLKLPPTKEEHWTIAVLKM